MATQFSIEQQLRLQLTNKRDSQRVKDACGWDSSQASRILSGGAGVTIENLDSLIRALDYVVVSRDYFDAIHELGKIGACCTCILPSAKEPQKATK